MSSRLGVRRFATKLKLTKVCSRSRRQIDLAAHADSGRAAADSIVDITSIRLPVESEFSAAGHLPASSKPSD